MTSVTKLVGCFVVCLLAFAMSMAQDKPSPLEQGKSLKELMPRIKPTETKDALKTFQVERGFKLELVAGEPLVGDPVDACFVGSAEYG